MHEWLTFPSTARTENLVVTGVPVCCGILGDHLIHSCVLHKCYIAKAFCHTRERATVTGKRVEFDVTLPPFAIVT